MARWDPELVSKDILSRVRELLAEGPERISAGELRGLGFTVPESIHDAATVPAKGLRVTTSGSRMDSARGVFVVTLGLEFVGPFEWVTIDVPVGGDDG